MGALKGNRYLPASIDVALHFNNRSGNPGPVERQSRVCPDLVRSLLLHWEWGSGHLLPLLEDKWPGLELGHETASEQSRLHGILGEQDLRPLTHRVTLKGRTASDCPSSRPSLQLFLSSLTALGCPTVWALRAGCKPGTQTSGAESQEGSSRGAITWECDPPRCAPNRDQASRGW